ncbi:hypothetical protein [Curtobacterium flaccumfaciens]|uniref:hypothetical protein n=1 Tax=Curtobacterium flaccumfaciens TaxID=2035 RepID=UPI001E560FD9|nr:hypothetical protein [Curtobacterium allii]MCE0459439.1 hypothetical protein [Curtobacterium allii]
MTDLSDPVSMTQCGACSEEVPALRYCVSCGARLATRVDLGAIFTASERAAGYAEVDQRGPVAPTLDTDDAVTDEPEAETEEPAGDPDARPGLRVLFGGLFGRGARPVDAADEEALTASEMENPSLRTLFRSWFRPAQPVDESAPLDEDEATSERAAEGDSEVPAGGAAARWWTRVPQVWIWGAAALVVVGLAGAGLVATTGHSSTQTTASTVSTSATTLPGWVKQQTWSKSGAVGDVGVTADGNYVGFAHGRTVTVLHAGSGRTAATLTLPGKAIGGVTAVTVDGKPALAAASKSAVTVWGAGKVQLEAGIPNGGTFQVRAGVPFVVTNSTAVMLTGHGAVPVTFPRPGALIMGGTPSGQVLWASARGEVLTAATNGTITRTAKLAAPKNATEISSWVVATGNTVWVRWKTSNKGSVLAAHSVGDGKVVSTARTSSEEPIAASQDGKTLLVQGTAFTASGKAVDMPKGFVADGFVGNHLYGADQDGTTAYVDGGTVRTGPAPTVVPVAENGSGDLIAVTNGRISTYAATDHSKQ